MYRKLKSKAKWLLLIFMILCLPGFGFNGDDKPNHEWDLAKESDGITIYYRWISGEDLPKTREMRARFTIKAGYNKIIQCFSNPEKYKLWAAGIEECRFEKANDTSWVAFSKMNYPWPFNGKETTTGFSLESKKDNLTIYVKGIPGKNSENSNETEIREYEGAWYFTKSLDGKIEVDYRIISYTKPVLPRFIQDPVIQKICIKSFNNLKNLAESYETGETI